MRTSSWAVLIATLLSCCSPKDLPKDEAGATERLVAKTLVKVEGSGPAIGGSTKITFAPFEYNETIVVDTTEPCVGAAGSILPPLTFRSCLGMTFSAVAPLLANLVADLNGTKSRAEHDVYLTGINDYWVGQSEANDCWAATLETARNYLRLAHIPQETMISKMKIYCPSAASQADGANMYQILYIIAGLRKDDGLSVTYTHICNDIYCIITSLLRKRPVIMLKSGHAVLIVGAKYFDAPGNGLVVEGLKVLDPADYSKEADGVTARASDRSTFDMCGADAFIAF